MNVSDAIFAGYRLEQLIITDTVSTTYRAISETRSRQRRPVALRITEPLDMINGPDTDTIAAFFGALNDAVAINHPALATIHDGGEVAGRLYVATDLVAGTTLDEHIRHHGPLPAGDAAALLRLIAEGLDHAHAAGVVHGAISPRTILVPGRATDPGAPAAILTGFGLDTLLARQARADRNRIDVTDVAYVAPEQLGGGDIDARVDQYALACALYHCVAGRPPFVRDTVAAMFGAHLFSDAWVPAGRDDGGALGPAVAVGMAKRPDDRHVSCVAFMRAAGHVDRHASARSGAGVARSSRDVSAPASATRPAAPASATRSAAPGSATRSAAPGAVAQTGRRRGTRRRRRPRRLPIAWPVAAMLVLAGIVCTLLLAAALGDDDPVDTGSAAPVGQHVPAGAVTSGTDEGRSRPAGLHWQRKLTDEPIDELRVARGVVMAATDHTLFALNPDDGAVRWTSQVDAGELTDVVVTDRIVGMRAAKLRGLSLHDGAPRWENVDVLTPVSTLAATDDAIYGVRQRQIASELVALDAGTGQQRWRFGGGLVGVDRDAAVAATDDHVVVLQDGHLFVVDSEQAAGQGDVNAARWHMDVTRPWLRPLVVLPDAVIVATRDGRVCAYAPIDGAQRWCANVVGLDEHEPAIVASGNAIAVVTPSQVTALARESGARKWVHHARRALVPTATSGGRDVVVVDVAGTVHGLDVERGHARWRGSGFGEITALTSTADAIYAGTRDSRVVRVRPDAGAGWS